jgi:hypothetical protein
MQKGMVELVGLPVAERVALTLSTTVNMPSAC